MRLGPLSPPVFRDECLSDVARLNYWMVAVVVVAATAFIPVGYIVTPEAMPRLFPAIITAWTVSLATLLITRLRHPIAAARMFVTGMWFITTGLVVITGGIKSPEMAGLLFVIAFSAVLLGWRECLFATAATIATVLLLLLLDHDGIVLGGGAWITPALSATTFITFCGMLAGLEILAVHTLKRAVTTARDSAQNLRLAGSVYDTTSDGIVVTLPDGEIIDVNDAFLRIHQLPREAVIGQNPRFLKSGMHSPEFYEEMWHAILETGRWQGEIWDRRADETLVPKWLSVSTVVDVEGKTMNYVGVFSDISVIKEGETELEWLATHDPLTKLPNRALIDDRLKTHLAIARRQESSLAVLFFDLDHFKDVNDTLGHPAGDLLLAEIGARCAAMARASDSVGRIGGDEFCIIAGEFASPDDLESLATRILGAVAEPIRLGDHDVYVTASMGIAVFPADGEEAADLMRHADVAMYRAKGLSGDSFEFFGQGLQDEFEQRVSMEARLRKALADDRLFLVYQPQVDLRTGRIVGVEALVRMRAEDGTIVMPNHFIGVAEYSGLAVALGDRVLEHALVDLRTLLDAGHDLTMAVNFSARQFNQTDVPEQLISLLGTAGIAHERFEVEITETALMTRMEEAVAKVERLLEAGIRVAIDDFGTGYASLSYVQLFHPNKIKIDRGFVSCLPGDQSSRAIVQASIALAAGIGASVVAEGPDSDDQVRFLQANGCSTAQGFWFSKPIVFEDLLQLLEKGPFALPASNVV